MIAGDNFLPKTPRQTLRRGLEWVPGIVGGVMHPSPAEGQEATRQGDKTRCLSSAASSKVSHPRASVGWGRLF